MTASVVLLPKPSDIKLIIPSGVDDIKYLIVLHIMNYLVFEFQFQNNQ